MIRRVAYELFEEWGYDRTTMRELARQAGIGLGTIFKHYPDKRALLLAAFEEDLLEVTEKSWAALPAGSIKAQLHHLARGYYLFYAQHPSLSRVMVQEVVFNPDRAGIKIKLQYLDFMDRVASLFEAAIGRGEVRPETDPMRAAMNFWSIYLNVLLMGLAEPRTDVEGQMEFFEELLNQLFTGVGRSSNHPDRRLG